VDAKEAIEEGLLASRSGIAEERFRFDPVHQVGQSTFALVMHRPFHRQLQLHHWFSADADPLVVLTHKAMLIHRAWGLQRA
jgi:hypothetical protein